MLCVENNNVRLLILERNIQYLDRHWNKWKTCRCLSIFKILIILKRSLICLTLFHCLRGTATINTYKALWSKINSYTYVGNLSTINKLKWVRLNDSYNIFPHYNVIYLIFDLSITSYVVNKSKSLEIRMNKILT